MCGAMGWCSGGVVVGWCWHLTHLKLYEIVDRVGSVHVGALAGVELFVVRALPTEVENALEHLGIK